MKRIHLVISAALLIVAAVVLTTVTIRIGGMKANPAKNVTNASREGTEAQTKIAAPPVENRSGRRIGSERGTEPGGHLIGNRGTRVYHRPNCNRVPVMSEGHFVELSSLEQAVAENFTPCKICRPDLMDDPPLTQPWDRPKNQP